MKKSFSDQEAKNREIQMKAREIKMKNREIEMKSVTLEAKVKAVRHLYNLETSLLVVLCIGVLYGYLLARRGFTRWYERLQKFQDEILRSEAEKTGQGLTAVQKE